MPTARPQLTLAAARNLVAEQCLRQAGEQAGRVGLEAEWLVVDPARPARCVSVVDVRAVAERGGALPQRSRITFEPGAQVELSTAVFPGVPEAIEALGADAEALGSRFAEAGLVLVARGIDPARRHERSLRAPRYDAMEAFFDHRGPAGRRMMCATAGLQVNLDLGRPEQLVARWRQVHAIGPALAAAFANSPMAEGPLAGWASARLATWFAIDRSRTAPARADRAGAWADYALDALVMCIRVSPDDYEPLVSDLSFREWLSNGHPLGYPDADDLEFHLTTLFPPVRPRGWLEVRYLDALPGPWWRVAAAVLTALVDDHEAASSGSDAVAGTETLWPEAARDGLRDRRLALAALACFDAAMPALTRLGVDADTLAAAKEYRDRFVGRGRCPSDEVQAGWAQGREWWCQPPI